MFDLTYKKERAAARKRQLAEKLTEEQALLAVLQQSAGERSLDELLAERRAEQATLLQKRIAQRQKHAERISKRKVKPYPADTWLGWFDGSASPNPGRMHIGVVLQAPESDGAQIEISKDVGHGDSSAAEYLALHALLEAALAKQPARLTIHGDSRVVIDDVLARNGKTSSLLASYRQHALTLMTQLRNVELVWVPRHRNQRADALSQAHGKQMKPDTTQGSIMRVEARPFLAAPDETQ